MVFSTIYHTLRVFIREWYEYWRMHEWYVWFILFFTNLACGRFCTPCSSQIEIDRQCGHFSTSLFHQFTDKNPCGRFCWSSEFLRCCHGYGVREGNPRERASASQRIEREELHSDRQGNRPDQCLCSSALPSPGSSTWSHGWDPSEVCSLPHWWPYPCHEENPSSFIWPLHLARPHHLQVCKLLYHNQGFLFLNWK